MIQTGGNCKDHVTKWLLHGCLERAQLALVKPSFVKIVSYKYVCCKTLTTLRTLKSFMKINYKSSILFDFRTYIFDSWKLKKKGIKFFTFLLTLSTYLMFNYDLTLNKNTQCNIKQLYYEWHLLYFELNVWLKSISCLKTVPFYDKNT